MDDLLADLKRALIEVMEVAGGDNGVNCSYCGADWVHTGTSAGGLISEYECPSSVDECAGNKAYAAMLRANEYLDSIRE